SSGKGLGSIPVQELVWFGIHQGDRAVLTINRNELGEERIESPACPRSHPYTRGDSVSRRCPGSLWKTCRNGRITHLIGRNNHRIGSPTRTITEITPPNPARPMPRYRSAGRLSP